MQNKQDCEAEVQKVIDQLKVFDERKETGSRAAESDMLETLIACGEAAVSPLIALLNKPDAWMSTTFAADALGEIGDPRAIEPLADLLEDDDIGQDACEALIKFGTTCISAVIKRLEYRLAHPVKTGSSVDIITASELKVLGDIHCDRSINFLINLLDDYIEQMPDEDFDMSSHDWKYINVNFFHLLNCLVRQQDKRAIPHIIKARDLFPSEYVDHKICQIAIGRIKKGEVEGYLPMEAMEIHMPSGQIMDMLSGGEYGWEDTFDRDYGEYFDEEEEEEGEELEAICLNCNSFFPANIGPIEFGICLIDEAFEPFIDELLENPETASCQELIKSKQFSGEKEACSDFEEMEPGIEIDENSP